MQADFSSLERLSWIVSNVPHCRWGKTNHKWSGTQAQLLLAQPSQSLQQQQHVTDYT